MSLRADRARSGPTPQAIANAWWSPFFGAVGQRIRPTIHLGDVAARPGVEPRKVGLKRIMSIAEPLTPLEGRRITRAWEAEVFDAYGASGCSQTGAGCERHQGLHLWRDLFPVDLLGRHTWARSPDGWRGR